MPICFPGVTGAKVDVGTGSSLQITGAFTVMCWFRLGSSPQNVEFVSKYKSSPRCWTLQTDDDPPDDTWGYFWIAKNSSQGMGSGWTASALPVGEWHHICGQFVPSTAVQIWYDGALSNENTSGVPATMYDAPSNPVTIGNRSDGSQPYDGDIEDVRIYDRNLSAGEMMEIYLGKGRDSIFDFVSRWPMNEGAPGTTPSGSGSVKDMGAGTNHGTPYGSNLYAESQLAWRRR